MFTSKIIFIVTIANAVTILVSSITLAKPVIAKKDSGSKSSNRSSSSKND